jgi:hypothetical protein
MEGKLITDDIRNSTPPDVDGHSGRCRDCDAAVGEEHGPDCGAARCLATGLQRLGCRRGHDCGRDLWTGWWPGELDCERLGWFDKYGYHDLNRLYIEAVWDPERCMWVERS